MDLSPAGKDVNYGYGRLDLASALNLAETDILAPEIMYPTTKSIISRQVAIFGRILGSNFKDYTLEYSRGRNITSWTSLITDSTQRPGGQLYTFYTLDTTTLPDTASFGIDSYNFRLRVRDTSDKIYEYTVYDIRIDNIPDTLISILPATTVSSPNQLVIYAEYQGDPVNPLTISSSVTITPLP